MDTESFTGVTSLAAWRLVSSGVRTEVPTPPSWRDALESYRQWLIGIGRPVSTVKMRTYHLRRFAATSGHMPFEVSIDDLARYLSERAWAVSTRRSVRASLRDFYRWAVDTGRTTSNPAAGIRTIPVPRAQPRPASDEAIAAALRGADARVRMMIALASQVGLRVSEVAAVHVDDLVHDDQGWSLRVFGKGRKVRVVPVGDDLARAIRAHEHGFLFPGQIQGHLSGAYVTKLVSQELPEGVTAHMLRHRFASRAYQRGGHNIRAVQELLGHSSVATTQIYTAVNDDELRRAAISAA